MAGFYIIPVTFVQPGDGNELTQLIERRTAGRITNHDLSCRQNRATHALNDTIAMVQ